MTDIFRGAEEDIGSRAAVEFFAAANEQLHPRPIYEFSPRVDVPSKPNEALAFYTSDGSVGLEVLVDVAGKPTRCYGASGE